VERAFGSVAQIHQVRANLTRLLAAVQDVQMGVRGYVLAGDQRFLQPYTFGVQQAQSQVERLVQLTRNSPADQSRLNALKPILDQQLAGARDTIALRDNTGFEAAQREVASGKGQAATDAVRLAIQEIDHEQAALLVKRSQAALQASALNGKALWTAAGLSFLLVAVTGGLSLRGNGRSRVAENESRTKTVMLHSVLNSINEGVAVADPKEKFLVFNPAAEQILGIGKNDAAPLQSEWFLSDQSTPFPVDQLPLTRALRGECVSNLAAFVRNSAHPEGWSFKVTAKPLLAENGSVMGAVMIFQDISGQKAAEAPVAPIAEPFVKEMREDREVAAAPPATPTALNLQPQSINTLIEQIVAMLAPAAAIQQISLSQQLASGLRDFPFDSDCISEVIMNLVTNALKATPAGGNILITTSKNSPDLAHVSVIDSGCGLTAPERERIFERRGGSPTESGTGLSRSRELVKLHGGDIWVKSESGKGATFTFSLPIKASAAAVATPSAKPAEKGFKNTIRFDTEIEQFSWKHDKVA
jgi:PAS domain S-box-containing protein